VRGTDRGGGVVIELLPPGTGPHDERWHELRRAGVTASEIAVVMGISPYDSPFNLYWSKVNDWRWGGNEYTGVGTHLEDAIADWWAAEHAAELGDPPLMRAGLYAHSERPWQLATPDRKVRFSLAGRIVEHGLLECKWVAQSWDGWGEQGTDEVPVYYRAQALWQLDVLGVDEVHVAVLGPTGFRAYLVRRDEEDLAVMRAAGTEFMRRLESREAPDLDGHSATISALQRLHPSVGEGDVEVPVELAERYRLARAERDEAKDRVAVCEAEIRAALGGDFNRAVVGKKLVASRSVFERTADDTDELHALDDGFPITDRLNPGRASSYA
jgi:putative phage-type endonuclease